MSFFRFNQVSEYCYCQPHSQFLFAKNFLWKICFDTRNCFSDEMDQNCKIGDNGITTIHVLLPLYTEFEPDIFLDILKKVVARTRLDEHPIDAAFMSGMAEKTIFIESEDLSAKEQSSNLQQIRISKLIGFWAANNFPSLGKKLWGQSWQPHEGRAVSIGNRQLIKTDKEIDAIIFDKFKLRVIELCVSNSTLAKIKHFVAVPGSFCQENPVRISKKMRMFDILQEHLKTCWQSLKLGILSMNTGSEVSFLLDKILCFD